MKKIVNKAVKKEELNKNTSIVKRANRKDEVIKEGTPLDHVKKNRSNETERFEEFKTKVGVSIGCTLNMENYESMRVDCWISDVVQDGETQEEALIRVTALVQNHLETTASTFKN